jgi:hypothetical protein
MQQLPLQNSNCNNPLKIRNKTHIRITTKSNVTIVKHKKNIIILFPQQNIKIRFSIKS